MTVRALGEAVAEFIRRAREAHARGDKTRRDLELDAAQAMLDLLLKAVRERSRV